MVGKEVKLVGELHAGQSHGAFVQRGKADGVDEARGRCVQAHSQNLEYRVTRGSPHSGTWSFAGADGFYWKEQRRAVVERAGFPEASDGMSGDAHAGDCLAFFPQPGVPD